MLGTKDTGFWTQIIPTTPGGCWLWQGYCNPKGYGKLYWKGRSVRAHRIAFELTYGPIPEGLFVCHSCDNPQCCNPEHLSVGTAQDNAYDAVTRRRLASQHGIQNSHTRLTQADVITIYESHEVQWRAGSRFGLQQAAVSKIRTGRRWGTTIAAWTAARATPGHERLRCNPED